MAHAFSIPTSSSISSPLFRYSSSVSSLSTSKQMFAVFIGSSVLMFIVILTMVLCFIDCLQKKTKQNRNLSMIKTNGFNNHNSIPLTNGKYSLTPLPIKSRSFYENTSSTHHYKTLKSIKNVKPVIVIAAGAASSSSNSHSSSSVDLTTRTNTAHNRAMTNTYTYTALSTSDDLMPIDFDDNISSTIDDNGIELMMTTV